MNTSAQLIDATLSFLGEELSAGSDRQSTDSGGRVIPFPPHGVHKIDIPEWIKQNLEPRGISMSEQVESDGTIFYRLSCCPYNPAHKSPDSAIGQLENGAVFFKCFHDSCQDKDWATLRRDFETVDSGSDAEEMLSEEGTLHSEALPIINVAGTQLRDDMNRMTAAIVAVGERTGEPLIYIRGENTLVRIVKNPKQGPRIEPVNAEGMRAVMSVNGGVKMHVYGG